MSFRSGRITSATIDKRSRLSSTWRDSQAVSVGFAEMIRAALALNHSVGPKGEEGHMRKLNGVFPAVVIDNVDPENLGRVQVQLPQMDESGQRSSKVWARIAT